MNWWLAAGTRKALDGFNKLSVEEQKRRMIEYGTINEDGEVLMGLGESKKRKTDRIDTVRRLKI